MGLYNLNPSRSKGQQLSDNICPICQKKGIKPVIDETGRDSFDYLCDNCKPGMVISVSGSVINSEYLNMLERDDYARNELQADVRQYSDRNYPLLTDTLSYFLRIDKDLNYRPYSYSEWLSGLLGSDLHLYKNIPQQELDKINKKRDEIFSEMVTKTLNELIADLNSRMSNSINKSELVISEISTVQMLLKGEVSGFIGNANLGNWEIPLDDVIKIQKYYREAVNGKLTLDSIVSPNQKTRIGSASNVSRFKVKAIAFNKYLSHLESIVKKGTSASSKKQERIELLKVLYELCDGSTSNSSILSEIAKKLDWDGKKVRDIAHTLMDLGYVEILTKYGDIQLTAYGLQTVEDLQDDNTNSDRYSNEELKIIHAKIDQILDSIEKLDLGHEVIFDEIESLKEDAQKMTKKDFKSMAIGKIFNLGFDGLLDLPDVSNFLKDLFGNELKFLK